MTFVLPLDDISACLKELESEFLRLLERESSNSTRSQLCAFCRLGIRTVWLMEAMGRLIQSCDPDGYYVLGRASWESCQLQLEFRLKESSMKAAKWCQSEAGTWSANNKKLDQWVQGLGTVGSKFGREFGSLAELAHPTFQATDNSIVSALSQKDDPPSVAQLKKALADAQLDLSGRVMREFWIIDSQHPDLIDLPIERANLVRCEQAFETFQKSLS